MPGKSKDSELKKLQAEFTCDKCDFKAQSLKEFLMHVKSPHQAEKETNITCVDCNLTFQREFDLQLHKSLKHPGKSHELSWTKTKTKNTKYSL